MVHVVRVRTRAAPEEPDRGDLAWLYPVVTFVVIIITANHYILDAVGGLAILAVGWFVANLVTRAGRSAPARAGQGSPPGRVA